MIGIGYIPKGLLAFSFALSLAVWPALAADKSARLASKCTPADDSPGLSEHTPRKLLKFQRPRYPDILRSRGVDGFVCLELQISPSGEVDGVRVVNAKPENRFEKAAIRAARDFEFEVMENETRRLVVISFCAVVTGATSIGRQRRNKCDKKDSKVDFLSVMEMKHVIRRLGRN